MKQGLVQEQIAQRGWACSAEEAKALIGKPDVALIDLREKRERERHGMIPGGLHLPTTTCKRTSHREACCACSPQTRVENYCSTVPSANALQWRCRQHRTPGSPLRAT
jgi:hypothetical protein